MIYEAEKRDHFWNLIRLKSLDSFRRLAELTIQAANDRLASVVMLNEMGFPADVSKSSDEAQAVQKLAHALLKLDGRDPNSIDLHWNRRWEQRSSDLTLLLGSFHCPNTYCNLMPLLQIVERGARVNLEFYTKKTSATKLGEYVRVLARRSLAAFRINGKGVVPMICLDMFDASQIMAIVENNLKLDGKIPSVGDGGPLLRADVVLVTSCGMPSYLESEIVSRLSALSRAAACLVVLSSSRQDVASNAAWWGGVGVGARSGGPAQVQDIPLQLGESRAIEVSVPLSALRDLPETIRTDPVRARLLMDLASRRSRSGYARSEFRLVDDILRR